MVYRNDHEPEVVSRIALLDRGMSDSQIRRAREAGELVSVLPGLYIRPGPDGDPDPLVRHRATLSVVIPYLAGEPVVSHVSAAILHGLPFCHSDIPHGNIPHGNIPHGDIRNGNVRNEDIRNGAVRYGESPPLHVTRPDAAKSRRGATVRLHKATLRPGEVITLGGLRVTSAERTVVDCALTMPFDHAVVLADAALRRRLVTRRSLRDQVASQSRVPGSRQAATAIAFADPRSRGPGESFSRVLLHRWGFPVPELDIPLVDADGRSLGRAAFAFTDARVLGEFVDPAPRPTGGRHVPGPRFRETTLGESALRETQARETALRETALREVGWRLVRWSWPDLRAPDAWAERLRTALADGP